MSITAVTTSASSIHADALITFSCCQIVAIPTPYISAKLRDNRAMPVAPLAITVLYASAARGPSNSSATIPSEVTEMVMVETPVALEALGATNHPGGPAAEDSTHASPQACSHATAALLVAIPAALPTVPPAVCPPFSLSDLITDVPPSGTQRTAWRSSQQTVSEPVGTPKKVPC